MNENQAEDNEVEAPEPLAANVEYEATSTMAGLSATINNLVGAIEAVTEVRTSTAAAQSYCCWRLGQERPSRGRGKMSPDFLDLQSSSELE